MEFRQPLEAKVEQFIQGSGEEAGID